MNFYLKNDDMLTWEISICKFKKLIDSGLVGDSGGWDYQDFIPLSEKTQEDLGIFLSHGGLAAIVAIPTPINLKKKGVF